MSRTILERIACGEAVAVGECLERYGGAVWALARRWSPNRTDAEDATQEIFIDIWKNAGRYDRGLGTEATFIAMIARRRLIDRQRKRSRTPTVTSLDGEPRAPLPTPADRAALSDEAAAARERMKQLRPLERQVLELAVDRGLSQSEIAAVLNVPLGTVKSHARRGLLQLRRLLTAGPSGERKEGVQ